MFLRLTLMGLVTLFAAQTGFAQEQKEAAKPAAQDAGDAKPASFEQLFPEWKQALSRLRAIQQEYQVANAETRTALEKEFNELAAKADKMVPDLRKSAEAAYLAAPGENKELAEFLARLVLDDSQRDNYEAAARVGKSLLDNGFKAKGLEDVIGHAAFEISDYDTAEKYLKEAEANKSLEKGKNYLPEIPKYREMWKKEQEIRAAEAEKDDLPRVLLKTSQGDITLEMFENEAPNTVANFIHLVEKDFYNGVTFHRVLPGFMAQGGDPQGTGNGGPGWNIPDEVNKDDYRKHFRGSLSMAKTAAPDSGGSQFFLCFRPTSHLDGKHTVFGRVIDGFDVLGKLKKRDPEQPARGDPDKIIEAKVLRKRDHEYVPKKVAETK